MSPNFRGSNRHPLTPDRSQPVLRFRGRLGGRVTAIYARHGGAISVQSNERLAYPDVVSACGYAGSASVELASSQLSSRATALLLTLHSSLHDASAPRNPIGVSAHCGCARQVDTDRHRPRNFQRGGGEPGPHVGLTVEKEREIACRASDV